MKITIVIIAVLAVLGIGGWLLLGNNSSSPQPASVNEIVESDPGRGAPPLVTDSPSQGMPVPGESPVTEKEVIREFTVEGRKFSFAPISLTVKKGETVRLTFKNVDGMHDWKLDEFKAATKVLQTGGQETIEFVADKAGTFEYYCSVMNHRAMGMKGTLTVTE